MIREETRQHREAVIYCRVSDDKQVKLGDGLKSQETRCREFARIYNRTVVEAFHDDVTGARETRDGLEALLTFLRANRGRKIVVIIDDISRLARERDTYWRLKDAVKKAGGVMESPNIRFGEDADSKLQEGLRVEMAQYQRLKNAEQTKDRMWARMFNGYWCLMAPVGYRHDRLPGHAGKMLARKEPVASILAEAFEGFASDRFSTQAEVMRFLEKQPDFPKSPRGIVTNEWVHRLLRNPLYCGCLVMPRWNVSFRKAQHAPLISLETWQKIQDKLDGKPKVPNRANANEEFPLRNFVVCVECGNPMTSCWSKGTGGLYPYYLCHRPGCALKGKSIARAEIEGAFGALLHSMRPTENLTKIATAMFKELWDHKLASETVRRKDLKAHGVKIGHDIDKVVDLMVETESDTARSAYEKRLQKLEREKALTAERIACCGRGARGYEETLRTAVEFLTSPWKLWESPNYNDKRLCLKLTFADKLAYAKGKGFRTKNLTLPFKVLADFLSHENGMARPKRFELLTPRFVGRGKGRQLSQLNHIVRLPPRPSSWGFSWG